jgi:hypothetical protein
VILHHASPLKKASICLFHPKRPFSNQVLFFQLATLGSLGIVLSLTFLIRLLIEPLEMIAGLMPWEFLVATRFPIIQTPDASPSSSQRTRHSLAQPHIILVAPASQVLFNHLFHAVLCTLVFRIHSAYMCMDSIEL